MNINIFQLPLMGTRKAAAYLLLLSFSLSLLAADEDARQKKLVQKINEITLPEINFHDALITDIARFLSDESRQLDTEKVGVNIVVEPSVPKKQLVTLSLHNTPLNDVFAHVARSAGVKYRIESSAVVLYWELPTSIAVDGVTYEEVVWGDASPFGVNIRHKTGAATIPLEKLPPSFQEHFDYDPQRAAEYKKAQEAQAREVAQRPQKLAPTLQAIDARDWEATWTRRDNSNVFDVVRKHKYSPTRQEYVATMTISGNKVRATAEINGNSHVYEGTISSDGRHITGTFDFRGRTSVHTWEVTAVGGQIWNASGTVASQGQQLTGDDKNTPAVVERPVQTQGYDSGDARRDAYDEAKKQFYKDLAAWDREHHRLVREYEDCNTRRNNMKTFSEAWRRQKEICDIKWSALQNWKAQQPKEPFHNR